jgi:DNA-binding transcriptional MerR regulator/predicted RNase H-like HicB family nuclease
MTATGFSADTARRLTGVTYRQLDYWDRTGLLRPSVRGATGKGSRRVYSFQDIVEFRVVSRMLASGVSLKAVRKAVRYLKANFEDVNRPLAQLTLVADGRSVLVRTENPKQLVDATAGGQVVVAVSVAAIARELEQNVVELSAPQEITFKLRGRALRAVLTPDLEAGGFTVEVPELPGVITEADSVSEARRLVREAAGLWLAAQEGARSHARAGR